MGYPTNYRYTREHEWIALEGVIGTIGITDYAQASLGDIVYVDVPKVGDAVTATNDELKSAPDKINEAPHEAWIIKVELSDTAEYDALLDAAAYEAFISEETGS